MERTALESSSARAEEAEPRWGELRPGELVVPGAGLSAVRLSLPDFQHSPPCPAERTADATFVS